MTSFLNTVRSEWLKLLTTKAFFINIVLMVVFEVGLCALMAYTNRGDNPVFPDASTLVGGFAFLQLVAMIAAILSVTGEYRYGTIRNTFTASPNRIQVMLAKVVLMVVILAFVAELSLMASYGVARLVLHDAGAPGLFTDSEWIRLLWLHPAIIALCTLFSLGIAMIVRHSAGAIAVVLLWSGVLEGLLSAIPKIGPKFRAYGPFSNLASTMTEANIDEAPWQHEWGIVYFGAWALAIFVIGLIMVNKRDA